MILFVLSSLLLVASLAEAGSECGVKTIGNYWPDNRIVGGENSIKNEWPWQVSFRIFNTSTNTARHICGGSIISNQWVLTAAHCVDNDMAAVTANIRVVVGGHSLSSPDPAIEIMLKVTRSIIHPQWNSRTIDYDYALLQLERPLALDGAESHLTPICLADPNHPNPEGRNDAVITGWGLTEYQGAALPDILQKAVVPVIAQATCKGNFGFINTVTDRMICAGLLEGGRSVCNGDSGGPLQYKHTDGKWYEAGITSWGVGCAWANYPGVFARVTNQLAWIKTNAGLA